MKDPEASGPPKVKRNNSIIAIAVIGSAAILLFAIFSNREQSQHSATESTSNTPQQSIVNVGEITIETAREKSPTEKDAVKKRIELLLEKANLDMNKFRLTIPSSNNAYTKYSEILQMEPDNVAAQKGVEKIVTTYVDMVMDSLNKRDFQKGKRYLKRAISISADKAALIKLQKQIEQLERQYKQTPN